MTFQWRERLSKFDLFQMDIVERDVESFDTVRLHAGVVSTMYLPLSV